MTKRYLFAVFLCMSCMCVRGQSSSETTQNELSTLEVFTTPSSTQETTSVDSTGKFIATTIPQNEIKITTFNQNRETFLESITTEPGPMNGISQELSALDEIPKNIETTTVSLNKKVSTALEMSTSTLNYAETTFTTEIYRSIKEPSSDAEATTDVFPSGITVKDDLPISPESASPSPTNELTATPATHPICKENEVYACLPLCPRTCNNPVSKVICLHIPSYIKFCRRGCVCRSGYLWENIMKKCVEFCPGKQPLQM